MSSKPLFIDTAYIYALINPNDQWHSAALQWQNKLSPQRPRLVTSEFVLTEIANGLSSANFREAASYAIRLLQDNVDVDVVPASSKLFSEGLKLYESRKDKAWGLTDCTSFVIMQDRGLTDALTTDDHFRQAGLNALLLE